MRQRIKEFLSKLEKRTIDFGVAGAALDLKGKEIDIAFKESRLNRYRQVDTLLEGVRIARAADPLTLKLPGGGSGFVAPNYKSIGSGPKQRFVVEAPIDTAFVRVILENAKQAAMDNGQWNAAELVGDDNLLLELKKAIIDSPHDLEEEKE